MKIVLAGGSGFLGRALEKHFLKDGHDVSILTRKRSEGNHFQWDGKTLGPWTEVIEHADVVINLAGKSVDCRYTEENKQAILSSRIDSTKILQEAISRSKHPPTHWINASSATIYIAAASQMMTERSGIVGDDFSMRVCKQWEAAFFAEEIPGIHKTALRTSIVLGNEGGAFPKYEMITRLGLGGKQGNGNQMVSWIHIEDFCRAVDHIIKVKYLEGVVNVVSPNPVPNHLFMTTLRKIMGVAIGIPQPKFLLELGAYFLGTESELLLKSRFVYPERLLKSDFNFAYGELEEALMNLV